MIAISQDNQLHSYLYTLIYFAIYCGFFNNHEISDILLISAIDKGLQKFMYLQHMQGWAYPYFIGILFTYMKFCDFADNLNLSLSADIWFLF